MLNLNAVQFRPRYEVHRPILNLQENQINYGYDNYYNLPNYNNSILNEHQLENKINSNSLEYLLSKPQEIGNDNEIKNKTKLSLIDFQKRNLDNLKEDLIYYFSSPESISHFKSSLDEEIQYEFYKDLDSENFLIAQKERFKQISSISEENSNVQKKISKLSNYNNSFCYKASLIQDKNQKNIEKLINANLIGKKMDESFFLYSQQEKDENKIIIYLNNLKNIFSEKNIDMESLGLIHFNFIEKNLISILRVAENKLLIKKNIKNLTTFCLICIDILKCFKSTKLFFYIIQFLKQNKDLLDPTQLSEYKETIKFIPNNCFDFVELNNNTKEILKNDLENILVQKGIIHNNYFDEFKLSKDDYISLNYDNYLLLFFGSQKYIERKTDIYFYYKINIINKNIIDVGKINLLKEINEKNTQIKIVDINISIKNEFIYFFYILYDYLEKYSLKCKMYNKYSITLIKEIEIEIKKSFIPKKLYNDNKLLYCISNNNEIFIIKKNHKLDYKKYINCSFRLFEPDLNFYDEIKNLSQYEMFNSLCINNFLILNNIDTDQKFIATLIINKNGDYILNLYEIKKTSEKEPSIKITYNDNKFIITNTVIGGTRIFYKATSKDFNQLMDKGISLLPFNSKIINYYTDNLYEYLIQEYSSFLNLCGNFDLINAEKEQNLIKYPFSFCCNFDENNLNFILNNLIDNTENYNIKLNYIIILKQIICSLYNTEILEEVTIKKIIEYLKKFILAEINSKEKKQFNKILKEIMDISLYMNNNAIIEIDEIKFAFDEDFNNISNKSKLLLIELLINQNNMKNSKELLGYLIKIEKKYLIDILNSESNNLSDNNINLRFLIRASESIYKGIESFKDELISLIPNILENIQILIESYQKRKNKNLEEYNLFYNSFNFRSFYLIIEFLLANKTFIEKKEYIIPIYKTLLLLDKININYNECFDLNNMIEITNYSFFNDDNRIYNDLELEINLDKKDIIIKTNLISNKELYNSIQLEIKTENKNIKVSFINNEDMIYHGVIKIKIKFSGVIRNINKKEFVINIIPINNEKLFNKYKTDKDHKIISLIEKSIIQYLLNLFEDANSQIEKYNKEKAIKSHIKLFQTEIFRFLSIPINIKIEKNNQKHSEFNEITNKLLEELDKRNLNNKVFNILNDELHSNFNKINKEIYKNNFEFENIYENKMKNNFSNDGQNIIFIDVKKYDNLFQILNDNLSEKNFSAKQVIQNANLNFLIKKIFLFGIKYYNCYGILNSLVKQINKIEMENKGDKNKNIKQIRTLDNYSLIYSFYCESFKIRDKYNKHRVDFNDLNFDEENKKYFDDNLKKLQYLYDNIIPCDDLTIKPNTLIIQNLLELLDNNNIEIFEIIQFAKLQNMNSQIKLIELSIINNLLLYLTDETNIILILNYIHKKIRHSKNILNSIFDNIYGADYYNIEKLKHQFHLFLYILSFKLTDNKNNFSILTQISMTENLIWKMRKRNFPILLEIMKAFEELKTEKQKNDDIFKFGITFDKIYNVNYFNKEKKLECKFNVFKILVYQIINVIKQFLKDKEEKDSKLNLERNPSVLLEIDFRKILKNILSFFVDINPKCIHYHDLILFFYKIFVNSDILLNYIWKIEPNVISKIIKISFDLSNNKIIKINNTRLIMIKLLCKIIENINEDNLDQLSKCIENIENQNSSILNPLLYIYNKVLNDLNEYNQKLEIIIQKYYVNLLFICLNKMHQFGMDENIYKNLISNRSILNLIISNDSFLFLSENKFIFKKNKYNYKYEDISLYNSDNNNSVKFGKILFFLEERFINFLNNISKQIIDNKSHIFDKSSFIYDSTNKKNKNKFALIIKEDSEQLGIYDLSDFNIMSITDLEIIETENKFKKNFIENNSKLIFNSIKEELFNDKLNEKGIFWTLKILIQLIEYLDKDDLILIFEYFSKFHYKNKSKENNYPFMSLEYIERVISKYFKFNNLKNIYKEKGDNNKSLYTLFDYIIEENILEINQNLEYIKKNYKTKLTYPNIISDIIDDCEDISKIYDKTYKLSNLSFYITLDDSIYKKINENSMMFIKPILTNNDLSELDAIMDINKNKIEVIIVNEISEDIDENKFIGFITNNEIPIYEIDNNAYQYLLDFFIKGEGLKNINLYENSKEDNNTLCLIKLNLDKIYDDPDLNHIEEIYKNLPDYKKKIIASNKKYKKCLCPKLKKGGCSKGENCEYAHSEEEKEQMLQIRKYLNAKSSKEDKFQQYNNKCEKIYKDLKDEVKNILNILNIKLTKRLILNIFYSEHIKLPEKEKIFKDIIYIYESLCLEYYFNIKENIYNESLREKLFIYFKKLSNSKEIALSENKWILHCFEQMEKIDYKQNSFNLDVLDLRNLHNEKELLDIFFYNPTVLYDKFLVILEILKNENNNSFFIKYYFEIINSTLNNIIYEKKIFSYDQNYSGNNNEYLILSKIINILYGYFCNKLANDDSGNENKISENSNIPIMIDETMNKLMKINLDEYFTKNNNVTEGFINEYNGKNKMTKQKAFLIEFIFKYLDLCLILLYKENQYNFFEYMANPDNILFKYYYEYKILTLEKNIKNKDYKENIAFIYYILGIIYYNNCKINDLQNNSKILELSAKHMNEYKFKYKSDFYDITIKKSEDMSNYNKIAIFCFKDNSKRYYFQDILDFNSHLIYDNTYNISVNKDIYLFPFKNIDTYLYSIENTTQSSNIENNDNSNKLIKYEEIPKYSWNIAYDGSKYLLLSEEEDQVYYFTEQKNYSESIKLDFNIDKKIKNISGKNKNNKIIDFIDYGEKCSSFAYTESGQIYLLDGNRARYKWLKEKEKTNIAQPLFIPDVQIINISANYNECYAIGKNGKLYYNNTGKNFKKIDIPENTNKFLQCACGNGYIICLVQNINGKGVVYVQGFNDEYQCGLDNHEKSQKKISELTKCKIDDHLDFKFVCTHKGFSAALTSCGKLFVWGVRYTSHKKKFSIDKPYLINQNKNEYIIIDKISLNHDYLYAFGRKLEDGHYIKKLFLLENNLSYPFEKNAFILKEINIIDKNENKSNIIPIKILIGQNRTYCLCIKENNLIKENIEGVKENEIVNKVKINISYKIHNEKVKHYLENMKEIYASNSLDKFIDSFCLFSDKNKKNLLKAFDEMAKGNIKTIDIDYNMLIHYLKDKEELKDLLAFFLNNEKNEGITLFNYLKVRISLIEENIMNYFLINKYLNSEGYVQKIIEQNITYLSDNNKLKYFLHILINVIPPENYNNQNMLKEITIDKKTKASNFKNEFNENKKPDIYLNETIFGQLFHSLGGLSGKKFLLEKGKQLFKVDFKGEEVIDEGGPYSETLSDICDELQSDYIELFIKTPNNEQNLGELREKYIINPSCNSTIYKKAYEFIGKLMALAISSGEALNLNFHPIIWKNLVENKITFKEYETIDKTFFNFIEELKEKLLIKDKNYFENLSFNFVINNLKGEEIELIENGSNIKLSLENVESFIDLAQTKKLEEINNQIIYIKNGLYSAIGKNILQILNWDQLEDMVCGEVIFNMNEFKKNSDSKFKGEEVVQWFWEWLENCKEEDKFKYLRFVSGKSRLPKSAYTHEIIVLQDKNQLPRSHTCYFILYLPKYDSKQILFEKMKYAIENANIISDEKNDN